MNKNSFVLFFSFLAQYLFQQ